MQTPPRARLATSAWTLAPEAPCVGPQLPSQLELSRQGLAAVLRTPVTLHALVPFPAFSCLSRRRKPSTAESAVTLMVPAEERKEAIKTKGSSQGTGCFGWEGKNPGVGSSGIQDVVILTHVRGACLGNRPMKSAPSQNALRIKRANSQAKGHWPKSSKADKAGL